MAKRGRFIVFEGIDGSGKTTQITLLKEKLESLGVPVYITRLDDSTLSPDERTRLILNAFGNDPNVIVISNDV